MPSNTQSPKKILSCVLIAIVTLGIFFGPFGAIKTTAQLDLGEMTPEGYAELNANNRSCGLNPLCWVVYLLRDFLFVPAGIMMGIGAKTLNYGIELSLTDPMFRKLAKGENGATAVTEGWKLSRDIVNLFLIFILLYIAIATILRVSGYGAKELLTTLIIVAFLVNFSGVITRMIIDASNVLAMGFYQKFSPGDPTKGIAKTFMNAFDAEKILNADVSKFKGNYQVIAISYISSTVIMLIAGFIFFAFGFLFFIRMVVLLLLIVFAPLAFGAMVLPSTKRHASKWWDSLFNQAFFAPAALFMLLLTAKMAGFVNTTLTGRISSAGVANMTAEEIAKNPAAQNDLTMFIVQFAIVAIMLCTSLVVSKQMGAMGASTAIAAGKTARRKVQGYAGTVGKRYVGAGAQKIEERAAQGKPISRFLTRIPLAGRGLAAASTLNQPEIRKWERLYGSYSKPAFNNLADTRRRNLLNMSQRKAIENVKARRKEDDDIQADIDSGDSMRVVRGHSRRAEKAARIAQEAVREQKDLKESRKTPEKTKEKKT